jgi:hypothetical protein
MEQVEKKVSGTEDKARELYHSVKEHEKMLRKDDWNMQDV